MLALSPLAFGSFPITQYRTGRLAPPVPLRCVTIAAASAGLIVSGISATGVSPTDSIIRTHAMGSIAVSQPSAAQVTRLAGSAGLASVRAIRA